MKEKHSHKDENAIEYLRSLLRYDPISGRAFWNKRVSQRAKEGDEAGVVKGGRYRYLTMQGFEMPMARIVWALHYGEWPNGNILFRDGDGLNTKIENLKCADGFVRTVENGEVKYRAIEKQRQHYGLMRFYGMSIEEYDKRLEEQGGVCYICHGTEPTMIRGNPRVLSVDHCHLTGTNRKLLCSNCNQALGQIGDNIETIERAIKYLEKHASAPL